MAAVPAADDVERMEFQLALRRRGISDQAVLRAMDEVPREYFVAPGFAESAYADQALPIACGQTISQPFVVAYMTEKLEVEPHHRVLEVGTGSGYQAAVLSRLAREVVSIERYRTLADAARERLKTLGYSNVTVLSATAWPARRTWRRSTASWSRPPPKRCRKRSPLNSPKAARWSCRSVRATARNTSSSLRKQPDGALTRENLIAVRFVPLLPGQAREL